MRIILQRVSEASVTVDEKIVGKIGPGLLLFVGIEDEDTDEDLEWLAGKIAKMRIFSDAEGKMNHSVKDVDGDILAVSQFTLHASVKKGNRPSFMGAARPEYAIPMYEKFIKILEITSGRTVETGEFGADMKVRLLNDGPVTIFLDSKNPE
ncbi:D-aminoacyl-tRNA deacylase [Phaeodactylibacter sp.]|jgi:D-tyrosyl-tRNA(Tyr) deacylase|uniref:D-aminoacyl-tRNA deacylase n=1 Tax=Phaeodactylibacter sp. TaxID=1940289 RepID=UPI0025D009AC|nr:D-aminoacyl-tRNA deacylase [Phaeodactylibacter sp.]MCI4649830.1 D-aminoacyl-tRNA deacylase [Phaeodactylibacter sp.]MCI5092246.1 D-aminoacyl-tRNA deacylase [Phaeodactylibacter sp.]